MKLEGRHSRGGHVARSLMQCTTFLGTLVNRWLLTGQSEQFAMLAAADVLQHLRRWADRMRRTGWTDFLHVSRGVQRAYDAQAGGCLAQPARRRGWTGAK